ncbi:MAG: ankyrin repeat domain-containing protein [Fimbriimonadales bacterium]
MLGSLGLALIRAIAQPGPQPAESIDVHILNSEAIVVGRIMRFEGRGEFFQKRRVTVKVDETLKGSPSQEVSTTVFAIPKELRNWQMHSTRFLLFVQSIGDYRPSVLIDLDNPKLSVTREDFKPIREPEDLLNYIREVVRSHPGVTSIDIEILSVPDDAHPGSRPRRLIVPADARLEEMAREWITANRDEATIIRGLGALRHFKSERNIALVRPLLASGIFEIERSAEENYGIELRRFVVREAAYNLIEQWKVTIPKPEIHESVNRYDTVEEISWDAPVTDAGLRKLEQCPKLRKLDFGLQPLTASNLKEIGRLTNLKTLYIFGTSTFNDASVKYLAGLAKLDSVDFTRTSISDKGLTALAGMKSLRHVRVELTEVTDAGLAEMARLRPDVTVVPKHVQSPIGYYAEAGNVDGIRRLLDRDPKAVEYAEERGGSLPLHIAAANGQFEAAKLLLDRGARVDSVNKEGETPLMLAASCVADLNMPLIKLLVSRGADVNRSDRHGDTALHHAICSYGDRQIRFLLGCGANPDARDRNGKRPIDLGESKDLAKFMAATKGPVPLIKRTKAECPRMAYRLQPASVSHWSSREVGRLTGPLQWSKSPSGRNYLGPFGQQAVTLRLIGLPKHRNVCVEVELFVIGSWDGNGDGAGPDILDIRVSGVGTALHSTFFNNTEDERANLPLQSFPDAYPRGFHKGYNGASEVRSLGFVQRYPRDAVYRLRFTFTHAASGIEIVLSGLTVPERDAKTLADDETWGIGGLTVKTDHP